MNEWSPGTNYSRPGTPNQSGRSFRSQWDDNEKGTKPLIVNIRAVSEKSKPQQQQQHSLEDVTKSSLSVTSKSKKNGADGSDPRFKRVISNGFQNDACVGTEIRPPKKGVQVKEDAKSKLSHWIPSGNGNSDQGVNEVKVESKESLRPEEAKRKPPGKVEPVSCSYLSQDLKEVTKSAFNHDVVKIASKESLSNCTVNTLNTSLTSDDLVDDVPNEIDIFPSASRVKKVHNWMLDQKPKVEKKQSLITVIGQTQGRDTVSSALREIDKRRKLVKELDKYAMCKKIIETEKGKDVSEMVAKITAVSSEEDSNNHSSCKNGNGSGDTAGNHKEVNEKVVVLLSSAVGTEPSPYMQKRSTKRKSKKNHLSNIEYPIKGKLQVVLHRLQYQWLLYTILLISGILCWVTFSSLHSGTYVYLDFFTKKPKTMTWYEKICMWLWELFRPSSNYKRSTAWNSY